MVRLIVYIAARYEQDHSSFNSMMVRLIAEASWSEFDWSVMFQFHDGAIDSKARANWRYVQITFQFHDGAIDRKEVKKHKNLKKKFQFHDGAIDSHKHFRQV